MKITMKENTPEKAVFTLSDVSAAYANALRRYMLGEVPTMAIDSCTFNKNDSVLYDEIIAHRLGLVVFKTDLDSYTSKKALQNSETVLNRSRGSNAIERSINPRNREGILVF